MIQRKKVALIFMSGTTLTHPDGTQTIIRSSGDVAPWIQIFPEIQMLADIVPLVVERDHTTSLQQSWKQVIQLIRANHRTFDSFAILHEDRDLTLTSAALTFGMPNMDDTIVVGSLGITPETRIPRRDEAILDSSDYVDVQSHFINLIRASLMPLHTIAILDDYKIYRAHHITRDPESGDLLPVSDQAALGTIDVLIEFQYGRRRRDDTYRFYDRFSERVGVYSWNDIEGISPSIRDMQAIVIDARVNPETYNTYRQKLQSLHHPHAILVSPSLVLHVKGKKYLGRARLTFESAVSKVMWMLEQGMHGPALFRQLKLPLVGEVIR
ncbi:MAG: hypothetical protein HYZ08_02950 [Candidatus Kerfeldbacteria bacterium]|nr:hypothetical protein [Candidatus Kerfeldbacteria bacterium]